jgi:hypothetical protein
MASDPGLRPAIWPGPVFFGFLAGLAVLKGLRMPSRWAATHYLLTYRTGFLKRALFGDVLWRIFGGWTAHYFFLAAVGLLVFAIFLALVVALCRRLPDGPDRVPLLLVFLASPALTFAAHVTGYLEQIAYVGVLIVALERRWNRQLVMALAAAAVLPCVHEASVFWVGGLSALALVAGPAARNRPLVGRLLAVAALFVVWTGSTFAASKYGMVSPERAAEIRDERTAFADTRPRQDAFQTLSVPLGDSLADMRRRWTDPNLRLEMVFSLLVFAPTMVFLGALGVRNRHRAGKDRGTRAFAAALVVISVCGPLLLHWVGWDQHRWNALAALNAGLAALIVLIGEPPTGNLPEKGRHTGALAGLALGIAVWNISSDPMLFDGYGPAHPPFTYQIQFLREAIRDRNPDIWVPRVGN